MKNKYTAVIRRTPRGWWIAKCVEIPGAMTQGRTKTEAKENLKDAIQQIIASEAEEAVAALPKDAVLESVMVTA
jgi:predicted RNase H-like HicB family nuclease